MEEIMAQGEQSQEAQYMTQETPPTPNTGNGEAPAVNVPPNGGQPLTPDFDPNQWNLNYKGRPIAVRDRNHLVSLATKGYGFDQEIERLKQKESQLAEMEGKYQQYGKLEQAFQQNPALAQRIFQMAQNPQEFAGDGEPEHVVELRQKLSDLENWKQTWEQRQADQDLDKQIKVLREKYPNHDWDYDDGAGALSKKILAHAYNNGNPFPSLEVAYKDFFWDNRDTSVKAQTLKSEQERIQREKAQGKVTVPGGTPPPQPKPTYSPEKSYNDLAALAAQRLTN